MASHPIALEMRACANGETVECFLTVAGDPIYSPGGVGAFLSKPTPQQALRAALRIALQDHDKAKGGST